jgi:hypothetical protein
VKLREFETVCPDLKQHDEEEPMIRLTTVTAVAEETLPEATCDDLIDAASDDAAQVIEEVMVKLGDGLLIVPVVGELTSTQPISTGLCIACHQPAGWHESDRVTAPDNSYSIWVHHRCK